MFLGVCCVWFGFCGGACWGGLSGLVGVRWWVGWITEISVTGC